MLLLFLFFCFVIFFIIIEILILSLIMMIINTSIATTSLCLALSLLIIFFDPFLFLLFSVLSHFLCHDYILWWDWTLRRASILSCSPLYKPFFVFSPPNFFFLPLTATYVIVLHSWLQTEHKGKHRGAGHFRLWELQTQLIRTTLHQLHQREAPAALQRAHLQDRTRGKILIDANVRVCVCAYACACVRVRVRVRVRVCVSVCKRESACTSAWMWACVYRCMYV